MTAATLLAVPNVSEGRDPETIQGIGNAFTRSPGVRLLDVHRDPDHHRSVFTLAGAPGALSPALLRGAREAVARIDVSAHAGAHPRIGALDVAPVVYLSPEDAGAACAEALVLADRLGEELGVPVFLYGILGNGRTRAEVRRGGPGELARRLAAGDLRPDFGPAELHRTAGAVLVGARPPLAAFNVVLAAPAGLDDARRIAAAIREGGPEGVPGLRALGLWLDQGSSAQVSMNVEDPATTPLAEVLAAVGRFATPAQAELVGLVPEAALAGWPEDVPLSSSGTIEDALAGTPPDG